MQQIVDLENSLEFQALNVALVSIAKDSLEELTGGAREYGVREAPLLSDANLEVSGKYDVLKWAVPSGEPGHTFILVDQDGKIAWIKDFGAPNNPNRTMYVPVEELIEAVNSSLN